ncbi:MAG: lactate racemase domain-containing protein [Planctomycetaceae bacterium]
MTTVHLPWGAWYQDETIALRFPAKLAVDVLKPTGAASMDKASIAAAIASPTDSKQLSDLAIGRRSACIVVDDMARPTQAAEILAPVISELLEAGISESKIDIVIATGSHGSLSTQEIAWKVGENISTRFRVQSHNCRSGMVSTGIQYGDQELRVNQTFMNADLRIAVGSVLPHSFAGYSGGAKLILPGIVDLSSISRSHKFVQLGLRGGADPNANGFRTEAEQIARQLGLEFVVCVVTGPARETTDVFCGDIVEAHRAACQSARSAFATPLTRTYDCAVLNAYPKDCDLVQAANAFVAWKTAKQPVVRQDGLVILATACSQGIGHHGLFDPTGISYRKPGPLRHLRGRELWLYVPALTTQEVHQLYSDQYRVFRNPGDLEAALELRLPPKSTVAVFPCAPMQQVQDQR